MPSHSTHHPKPNRLRRIHLTSPPKVSVGTGAELVGDGSTHISPNHSLEVQLVLDTVLEV